VVSAARRSVQSLGNARSQELSTPNLFSRATWRWVIAAAAQNSRQRSRLRSIRKGVGKWYYNIGLDPPFHFLSDYAFANMDGMNGYVLLRSYSVAAVLEL